MTTDLTYSYYIIILFKMILTVREKTKQNKQNKQTLNLFKIRLLWYDHLPCTHPAGSGI